MWTQHTLAHTVAIIPLGNEVVLSISAIISNLSNLNFFSSSFCLLHGVLMKTFSWPEHCWLRAPFGSHPGNWPCWGLPHLPSLELLLIAIWLFLVSSSVCWVRAGKVHPAVGVGLRAQWGFHLEMFWHFVCQGTGCWKTRESKQELRA